MGFVPSDIVDAILGIEAVGISLETPSDRKIVLFGDLQTRRAQLQDMYPTIAYQTKVCARSYGYAILEIRRERNPIMRVLGGFDP